MTIAYILLTIAVGSAGLAYFYNKIMNYRAQARAVKRRAKIKLQVSKHEQELKDLSQRKTDHVRRVKEYKSKYPPGSDSDS